MERKQNKGFTLAELLIVVAIIAVLVAISIPIFSNQMKKARLATNQANARAAAVAAEAAYMDYLTEHGSVPVNPNSYDKAVTYTYFITAGKGVLNFRASNGALYKWVCDANDNSNGRKYGITSGKDISSWTTDTVISKGAELGDMVALIWTIHMDPSSGKIKGYYCAFPKASDEDYINEANKITSGT